VGAGAGRLGGGFGLRQDRGADAVAEAGGRDALRGREREAGELGLRLGEHVLEVLVEAVGLGVALADGGGAVVRVLRLEGEAEGEDGAGVAVAAGEVEGSRAVGATFGGTEGDLDGGHRRGVEASRQCPSDAAGSTAGFCSGHCRFTWGNRYPTREFRPFRTFFQGNREQTGGYPDSRHLHNTMPASAANSALAGIVVSRSMGRTR